jgi:hypothetical protein
VLDGEMVFVPGEIPRRGAFALWGKGSGSAKVELVFPGGTYGIRKRLISADLIPLAEALPMLLAIDLDERAGRPERHSVRVWAAAADRIPAGDSRLAPDAAALSGSADPRPLGRDRRYDRAFAGRA